MVEQIYPFVRWIARTAALIGGAALLILVGTTVASIVGRNFTPWGPIPGDFELVEAGVAFAIFAFMPWCQLNRGHATVEIFAARLGRVLNNIIDLVADLLLLAVWIYLGYRHYLGTLDKQSYNETTFILQFPIWWAYAAALAGFAVIILTAVFCVMRSLRNLATGRRPAVGGPVH